MYTKQNEKQKKNKEKNANKVFIKRAVHNSDNPFTQISNRLINDKNLTGSELGTLVRILQLPENWKVIPKLLAKSLGMAEKTIYRLLKKYQELGYCKSKRIHAQNGLIIGFEYYFFENGFLDSFEEKPEVKANKAQEKTRSGNFARHGEKRDGKKDRINNTHPNKTQRTTTREAEKPKEEKPKKPIVVGFYKCLQEDDRLTDANRNSLNQYPEDRVILALKYSLEEPFKQSLIQQLVWHCQQKTPPVKTEKIIDKVSKRFEHYGSYNGAICYFTKDLIAFERGTKNISVKLNSFNFKDQFINMTDEFGIDNSFLKTEKRN